MGQPRPHLGRSADRHRRAVADDLIKVRSALIVALLSIIGTAVLARPASAAPTAQAAPGALDTSFGGFGFAWPSGGGVVIPPGLTGINDIAVQPDGKTVVVGSTATANQLAVYRYLPDGRPDTSFDGDGQAIFSDMFGAKAVALQSNGRIVVGGTRDSDFQLVRLTPSGVLDLSFDGDGWDQDFDPQIESLSAILVQADGKIVACGDAFVGGDWDFGVTRYNTNGSRDNSFSGDGKATIPFGRRDSCEDVVQQTDGKLVVVGDKFTFENIDFAVARLKSDGTLDTSFDGDGKLTTGFGGDELATAVTLQADGKIVVLGAANSNNDFNETNFNGTNSARALVVQPDRRIVIGGSYNGDFVVQRLLENGERDPTFGLSSSGYNTTDLGGVEDIRALALAPNGWLYAAGSTSKGGGDVALAIYQPNGRLAECQSGQPCDHWPTGTRLLDLGGSDLATALALRGDGQLVAAGCSDLRMAAAQVSTGDATADPLLFRPDFAGDYSCARGVQFSGNDKSKIVLGGTADTPGAVIGLARFQTTPDATRLDQTIAFPALPDRLTTDPPFELRARASSGLPVSFTSSTPKICGVSGTTLRLTGEPGVCSITAEQAGDATYDPAPSVTQSFQVRDPAEREQAVGVEPDSPPAQVAHE